MPFQDANSQLEPLLFAMKQYKNMTKSTIEVLPSSGQTIYTPGRKAIFTLPYASLISLEDIALHFSFTPTGVQNTTTDGYPTLRVLPPKDIASLIEEVDIKINGQTIQHLTRYNDIVNLLNYFDQPQSAKRVLQNADATQSYIKGEHGQFVSMDTNYNYDNKTYNEPKAEKYVINHWYGLLGHRGDEVSSNFVDTNMLGEVTIAFTFASAATCFKTPTATGAAIIAGFGKKADASATPPVLPGSHPTSLGNAVAIQTEIDNALLKNTNVSYQLTDLKMSMVRYNLPQSYSEALASNLSSGAKYQIAFNHYEIRSQHLGGVDKGTLRWNENSRDIKGLMAFFTNTLRADSTLPSTYDPKVESSAYFNYGNPIHDNSQFQIGSVKMPQNTLDSTDAYLELIRAVPGARGYNRELMYQDDMSVNKWLETYFMAYLSLEMTEGMTTLANGGKKLLSGLSSEQLPISCSYSVVNDTRFKGASTPDKTMNVMTLSTRLLVIENGQNVFVEI
tara:strand:+ start:1522 stop:3036 length:1515 start_codon:yes stop_codon:yes gene_type:complete